MLGIGHIARNITLNQSVGIHVFDKAKIHVDVFLCWMLSGGKRRTLGPYIGQGGSGE